MHFIIDAHLDLSMNALEWNRDLRLPVEAIRRREKGLTDKPDREKGTVSLPALREGNIGLVVATQIARYVKEGNPLPGWHSPEQAWAQTQGQLSWYRAMEDAGEMRMIRNLSDLEEHLIQWENREPGEKQPIGYILSLEGADSIINIEYLDVAYNNGLRALGPAHYGPGRYANGTDSGGKMGEEGINLLRRMEELGIILDATHLCDDAFWQAMEIFNGNIWASHHNCRALVNHNRQLSDDMIRVLIEKDAVMGAALDAWMMVPNWVRGKSTPENMNCRLETIIDHIDHICQIAGNSKHVGIGTDLDGAFGKEQCPVDLNSIADLQKLPALFQKRGYSSSDISDILHGNWLRFLRSAWSPSI